MLAEYSVLTRLPSVTVEDQLSRACSVGDLAALHDLLSGDLRAGAPLPLDANASLDDYGCTALHRACAESQADAVLWLLENGGADPDICDAFGKRPASPSLPQYIYTRYQ